MFEIRRIKGKGRGLVASGAIAPGTTIVSCPVVVYDDADAGRISKTRLGDYNFRFGTRDDRSCIVLGPISLCNHSETPNAEIRPDEQTLTMTLLARQAIAAGEEICIRYRRKVWWTS